MADCAGSGAAEARSDGPCGLRSAVAHRCDKRRRSDVGDHEPPHEDIWAVLGRRTTALDARDVTLGGVTPAGASRSPEPRAEVCDEVPQHVGEVPVVKEVVKAVCRAVASVRERRAAPQPTGPTGRPSTQAAQAAARKQKRLAPQGAAVDHHRHLCVPHPLSRSDRTRWGRITRGLPPWRTRRERLAQVDAVGARRCRTQTALATLATRRHRLQRFQPWGETRKTRCAPTLENALTVLDDTLLPSTSHAVERGNRRSRTRPKHVYRVRTQAPIEARLALDMWREAQGEGRHHTLRTFHEARAG